MTTKAEMERMEAELAKAKARAEEAEAILAEREEAATGDGLPNRFEGLDGDAHVQIVTTAAGSWGMDGILPAGTAKTIPVRKFSRAWMKPADQGSAAIVNKWVKAVDLARKDKADARQQKSNAIAKLAASV